MNTKNERLFVSDDLASELIGKGFNEPCMVCYNQNDEPFMTIMGFGKRAISIKEVRDLDSPHLPAPLYQQVTNWLIDKHKIYVMVYPRDKWNYSVQGIDETISCSGKQFHGEKFESHYEALDKAIEVALTLIK
jgi:hypothetical protein